MQKIRLVIIILITVLVASNILLAVQYALSQMELKNVKQQLQIQKTNQKSLFFAKLFVNKFLLGQGTVSFEDRLVLENAVRDINDPTIFKQWQTFTNSQTDYDAQKSAGVMLNLLLDKLSEK